MNASSDLDPINANMRDHDLVRVSDEQRTPGQAWRRELSSLGAILIFFPIPN